MEKCTRIVPSTSTKVWEEEVQSSYSSEVCGIRVHHGYTAGTLFRHRSDTVPLPVNTVTVAGEGMTLYMFGYSVIPKNIKLLPAHHCISLTVLQVVFSQPAGDAALCCAEQAFLSCPVLSPS